jgi:hypothetical protein
MDVTDVVRRYRQSQIDGNFNKRTHFREALVWEKDNTAKIGKRGKDVKDRAV